MRLSIKNLTAQLEASEPGSTEACLLLETIQQLQKRIEQANLFNPKYRSSMELYLKTIPFYKDADLSGTPIDILLDWCNEQAAAKLYRDADVQAHHTEESEQDLL